MQEVGASKSAISFFPFRAVTSHIRAYRCLNERWFATEHLVSSADSDLTACLQIVASVFELRTSVLLIIHNLRR